YRPDLTITDVSVPATAALGRPFTIRQTTRNVGPAPSSGFLVQYYLSTDDTLDGGDVALGTRGFGGLGAGAARTDTATLVLPGNLSAPARYRIIAVATLPGTMPEMDTSNNTGVSGPLPVIPYLPDLRIAALTLPASGATGRPLRVRHTIQNLGPAPAAAFTAQFYLSTDDTLDVGDVLLGSRVLGGLGPGGSRTEVSTVTLPANTSAPASYRVIMVVDALGQQAELDETNNTAVSDPLPVTLYRPDLRMSALTAPARAAVGRPLTVRYTLRNDGPAPSGMFTVRFYLSTDGVFDPGDVLLRSWVFGGLGPGASRSDRTTLLLPANTSAPATYQVIAVVDALDQQAELSEDNNVTASDPIAVTLYRPDLSISTLTVPTSGAAGRPLTIRHTVANTGPAPAGAFAMRFFLSTDDVFDTGDVLLGSRVFSGLGVGASRTDATALTLPANTSVPASSRVIAVVDALDQQAELSEDNNVAASDPISVTAFVADLAVSDVRLLTAVSAGHALPVHRVVRNVGPAPSGPAVARVFLSADGVLDAGDVVLGACPLGPLAAGAVSNALCTVTVPATTVVPPGAQVIVVAAQVDGRPDLDTRNDVMAVPAS
ncbi:MAG TPA: CARDB domain-containing protein, partial [Methylomirabilota bacterium]|nr:CARDB domain-containing protein [Methylomirabilota bacterium]